MNSRRLILASASPRRRELLTQAGYDYEVIPSACEEVVTRQIPKEVVEELSLQKASDVADSQTEDCVVIGADTIVAFDGRIMGKPKNEEAAREMLSLLQGQTHQVYTGVTILAKEGSRTVTDTFFECTQVTMYPMSEKEIQFYISTGECMDKAGAYGIQGRCAIYIQKIDGDYNNVVGLPIARLYHELSEVEKELSAVSKGV